MLNIIQRKYQLLLNKLEKLGLKHFNDPKAFIDLSNNMNNIYENIEEYNQNKKKLIVFDDMIVNMLSKEELTSIVIELLII